VGLGLEPGGSRGAAPGMIKEMALTSGNPQFSDVRIRFMGEIVPVTAADLATRDLAAMAAVADVEMAAAEDLASRSVAASTRAAYVQDMEAFAAWCEPRGLSPLPADPATVLRYLASAAIDGLAVATIRRRLTSIAVTHKAAGHPDPTKDEAVVRTWRGIRRTRTVAQRKVRAVRASILRQLVEPLTDTWPADIRDRAILTIGMAGALRRSEIVAIDVEHVTVDEDGLRLRIPRSKRDQEGEGALVGIPWGTRWETCPVSAWEAWLQAAEIRSGPAFRAVDRHGNVSPRRLTDRQIARIVQRRADAVGLPGAEFGGHSLRAGFATEAVSRGRSELAVMRHGRWRSGQAMRGYVQEGGLWKDNAAKGLGL
jgi:site-specific recombinase XerD